MTADTPHAQAHGGAAATSVGPLRNAAVIAVALVSIAIMGIVAYASFLAKLPFGQLSAAERIHVAINAACVAVVAMTAWRARGQLDQKLAQTLNTAIVTYGVFFLLILGGRWFFSRQLLLSSFVASVTIGMVTTVLKHRLNAPRVGVIGPLATSSSQTDRLGEVITDPSVDLRAFDVLLVTFHGQVDAQWAHALSRAMLAGCKVRHVGEFFEQSRGAVSLDHFDLEQIGVTRLGAYRPFKRILDLGLVLFTLPISLPLIVIGMFAVAASMGRPIFFVQDRVGLGGRVFRMWKLRTMRAAAHDEQMRATQPGDPRITRVGALLRRFRIDELPQLWNVLRGDMTLIGPRPEALEFHRDYLEQVPAWAYRTLVRPGITGWAQVCTGPSSNPEEARRKLAYDLYYVKNVSWVLDLKIAIRTLWVIPDGNGVR